MKIKGNRVCYFLCLFVGLLAVVDECVVVCLWLRWQYSHVICCGVLRGRRAATRDALVYIIDELEPLSALALWNMWPCWLVYILFIDNAQICTKAMDSHFSYRCKNQQFLHNKNPLNTAQGHCDADKLLIALYIGYVYIWLCVPTTTRIRPRRVRSTISEVHRVRCGAPNRWPCKFRECLFVCPSGWLYVWPMAHFHIILPSDDCALWRPRCWCFCGFDDLCAADAEGVMCVLRHVYRCMG